MVDVNIPLCSSDYAENILDSFSFLLFPNYSRNNILTPNNRDVRVSGVQHQGFDCTIIRWVHVAKVSGFLLQRVYNWDRLLSVIRSSDPY